MKTGSRLSISFFLAVLLLCTITTANPEILASHNAYREEVGVVPLTYNTTLAASAQAWAEHDAALGLLVHSDPAGRYGENIARWSTGYVSWTDIVVLWGSEKSYFIYGPFGNGSSTTGDLLDVGHYTQIVWNTTTQCGCGKATNVSQNADYYVCQYSPPGNYLGRYPYPETAPVPDTTGLYQRSDGTWFLKNSNSGGNADLVFPFGWGSSSGDLVPLTGDWTGSGVDTVGVYQKSTGTFFLKNSNGAGPTDTVFTFGWGGDDLVPLAGDWRVSGVDTIGLYQKSTGTFFLKNSNGAGNADTVFHYGAGGDDWSPLVGDWDGDGDDTAGLYQTSIGVYFVKNSNGPGDADTVFPYGAGGADWIHLSGDWDGDGHDTVGAYQKSIGVFFLKNSNAPGNADLVFPYGPGGDDMLPVVGRWV